MGIFFKQNIIWKKLQFFSIAIANFLKTAKLLSPTIYSEYYLGKSITNFIGF